MEKVTIQSSERILEKAERATNNPQDEIEIMESVKRLSKPFKQINYLESGVEEMEVNDGVLEIGYVLPESNLAEAVREYLNGLIESVQMGEDDPVNNVANWRRLTRLKYAVGDKTYDLLKLFPESYNIFFCPQQKDGTHGTVMSSKNIFIIGDIATPKSLIIILHEIGHIWDFLKLKVAGKEGLVDEHKYAGFAEELRRERVSSAYALNALRPFLKNAEQKKDVINFLMNDALLSYNVDITENIRETEYMEEQTRLLKAFLRAIAEDKE